MSRTGLIAGVDLGGTKVRIGVADAGSRVLREIVLPTPRSGPARDLAAIVEAVRVVAGGRRIAALGLGVPGVCDRRRGLVVWAPNLPGWRNVPAAEILRRGLRCRVVIENDADMAALGEVRRGAARGCRDALVLTIGTGIGAGLIVDGGLVRGAHGVAGAAGWMRVGGRRLEDLASGPAIARGGVARAGAALGEAVASLVSVLNPEVVVLGGGVMDGRGGPILRAVRRAVRGQAQPVAARRVRIVASGLRNRAGMLGAIRSAMR